MTGTGELIGARVREIRTALKLTQAEVSRRSNIQRRNIARIEAGEHVPTLDSIVRLSIAMHVQPSEILRVLDDPTRDPYPLDALLHVGIEPRDG